MHNQCKESICHLYIKYNVYMGLCVHKTHKEKCVLACLWFSDWQFLICVG